MGQMRVTAETIGTSVRGIPIRCYTFGRGSEVSVFFGAFHGDEPLGAPLLVRLCQELEAHPEWLAGRTVHVVPEVNPDGLRAGTRTNANGVDINRNFPTSNWRPGARGRNWGGPRPACEPETRAVIALMQEKCPHRVVSIHAPLREVNYDGPAAGLAEWMARFNGYPTAAYIGYPTPGSFGTYAGKERAIPTITLELPDVTDEAALWNENRGALLGAVFWVGD